MERALDGCVVKWLPPEGAASVVSARAMAEELPPAASHRAVVEELIGEARTDDRAALERACEAHMAKARL